MASAAEDLEAELLRSFWKTPVGTSVVFQPAHSRPEVWLCGGAIVDFQEAEEEPVSGS
ncbi:hypothetical protein ACIREM_27435 [Streptomyces shenzhenensis]|uniref:hypothetical protein n=1 Tax=Streptomyces shenzhenensis TaxID=943815 RepID=UPI0037F24DB1